MAKKNPEEMDLPQELKSGLGIRKWARRYSAFERHKDRFIRDMLNDAFVRETNGSLIGHLTRSELLMVGEWKSSRQRAYMIGNDEKTVVVKSHAAFVDGDIRPLTDLDGVGLPTASGIMHFVFSKDYPIMDVRTLNTLGIPVESSDISRYSDGKKYWRMYKKKCCDWADGYEVDLRTLDRALWQYGLAD